MQPLQRLVEQTAEHAGQHLNALDFCEFPAINEDYRGKAYRYMYCLSAVRPTNMGNALTKVDLIQGAAKTWYSPGGAVGKAQSELQHQL
jgi:carotenoid cleavage dioxygenase-like enzyme